MGKTYSNEELLAKAALAVTDITTDGGVLEPEQLNEFLRIAQESQAILSECRVEVCSKGQKVLDRIGMSTRFLRPGVEDDTQIYTAGGTRLAKEVKPTLGKITISCFKVSGDTAVSWETLQRNIEKDGFSDTLIEVMSKRAAFDLEDGWLERVPAANTIDWQGAAFDYTVFNDLIQKIPGKHRRNLSEFRFYVPHQIAQAYRLSLSSRNTGLGDTSTTDRKDLLAFGVPVVGVDSMPGDDGGNSDRGQILLAHPKNLILAVEDEMRVLDKYDEYRDSLVLFFHASVDVSVEEVNALAKATDVLWSDVVGVGSGS